VEAAAAATNTTTTAAAAAAVVVAAAAASSSNSPHRQLGGRAGSAASVHAIAAVCNGDRSRLELAAAVSELAARQKQASHAASSPTILTESSAMLRSIRALTHSVTAASGCFRMFSQVADRVACSTARNPIFFSLVRHPAEAVKYCCETNTIAEHVRSLLIFPESSFASDRAGGC